MHAWSYSDVIDGCSDVIDGVAMAPPKVLICKTFV